MSEICENDWKFTRKKTVDIQIFIAITCPIFALLFLTEFNFFNPPLHRPLAILASAIMYIVILFCLQVPISIYFLGYRRILKNSFVKKYRFDDGKLVWIGPLGNKHSIDIKDIFCILILLRKIDGMDRNWGVSIMINTLNFYLGKVMGR
ncbi:MAG: hypothetical protein ACOCZJ_03100 [Thermoplasmatota archaeon]